MLTFESLTEAVEGFLVSRTVAGCTSRTVQLYHEVLGVFARGVAAAELRDCTMLVMQTYLTTLRERVSATTVHLHFSKLRAFFSWCVESGLLTESPLRGVSMRAPKTLPHVPEDDAIRGLLQACPDTFEGRRNRALVALLADSGLRISEALRLRIEDLNFAARTVNVRAGKGQKDGVGFFGAETAQFLRAWLSKRRDAHPEDYLFVDRAPAGKPVASEEGELRWVKLAELHTLPVLPDLPLVLPHVLRAREVLTVRLDLDNDEAASMNRAEILGPADSGQVLFERKA